MYEIQELYDQHKNTVDAIAKANVDLQVATRVYRTKLFSLSAKICIKEITVIEACDENMIVTAARDRIQMVANNIVKLNDQLAAISIDVINKYTQLPRRLATHTKAQ